MTIAAWVFLPIACIFLPSGILMVLFHKRLDERIERNRIAREKLLDGAGFEWPDGYLPMAGTPSSILIGTIFCLIGLAVSVIVILELW